MLRLLRDVPAALQHVLTERSIVPDVVPLVPVPRRVSYQYRVTADSASVVHETLDVRATETQDMGVAVPIEHAERIA